MENQFVTIEGINFDLAQVKKDIAELGSKEAFIERAKQLWWVNVNPAINEATLNKRIVSVYDAATAYGAEPKKESASKK